MTVKEFVAKFQAILPLQQAEDFDNVGLLCGNPENEISGILVSHDTLEAVVEEAIEKNCNLIVAFHPIIFSGLKTITGKNYVERTVLKAIENKVAIYAVHTAFDNDFFGVNFGICKALNLQNRKILMPKNGSLKFLQVYVPIDYAEKVRNALFDAGAGKIGFYDECNFTIEGSGTFRPINGANPFSGKVGERENAKEVLITVVLQDFLASKIVSAMKAAHPYEEVAYQLFSLDNTNQYLGLGMLGDLEEELDEVEFLEFIKEKFSLKVIRHSSLSGKKIRKVGVLGGSGSSGISAAKSAGCDAYITADLKYHDFFQSEGKTLLCDIGHLESEQFVTQQLFEILSEKFPTFAISKSNINTNPINYYL